MKRSLRKTFLAGTLLVMPLLVTWFLISFVFDKVNENVTPLLRGIFRQGARWLPWLNPDESPLRGLIPFIGLFAVLGVIFVVGLMGSHYVGKKLIRQFNDTMLRVPLIKGIYGSAKQLFDAFNIEEGQAFERVVLVQYPRLGIYTLAFVTRAAADHVRRRVGVDDLTYIFIPTTPNPTSGFLLLISESELVDTGMSIEQGLKTIVSGGMVPMPPPGGGSSGGLPTSKPDGPAAER